MKLRKKLLIFGILGVVALLFISGSMVSLNDARQKSSSPNTLPQPFSTDSVNINNPIRSLGRSNNASPESAQYNNTNIANAEGELTQRKIIKNGSLDLLVDDVEDTAFQVKGITERLGGYISNGRVYQRSTNTKAANITVRVPADKFAEAMDEIKQLAVDVEQETETAQDVTEKFTDLEARLRSLEAQEEQYLGILEQADTIQEILTVTQRLDMVREDIELIQGQLIFMSRQIDMATINVSLTSDTEAEIFGIRWKPILKIKAATRDTLESLASYVDAMTGFIIFLPVLAIWLATWAVGIYLALRAIKWVDKRYLQSYLYKWFIAQVKGHSPKK